MIVTVIVYVCPKCGSEDMVKKGHDYWQQPKVSLQRLWKLWNLGQTRP